MRLSPEQITAIKQVTADSFGEQARVHLFGSRVDDHRRGGDIDLYIETDPADDLLDRKARFIRALWRRIGPQRIDVVIRPRNQPLAPIHRDAREHGVEL